MNTISSRSKEQFVSLAFGDTLSNGSTAITGVNETRLDAGLRNLDHYKKRLPAWRYALRQYFIPLVRWESPYLAVLQNRLRRPSLDSYFAITANLGTHTFYMIFLPIMFWFGHTSLGRAVVHILASGVFLSGFLKDMLCLPRPLSPPLCRITMSDSVALEYGFPSTHSTNAVSVAILASFWLNSPDSVIPSNARIYLEIISYAYVLSIVLGRLYCGMHGFFDVVVGGLLGAFISYIQWFYGNLLDEYLLNGSLMAPLTIILVILLLIRIHPEPADDCPCFDDSVAFSGVVIGIEIGYWHFAQSGFSWNHSAPATATFKLTDLGWLRMLMRTLVGVLVIFAWKGIMKPVLLRSLPPLYRIIERLGLTLPRRFFKQASEYKVVPNINDDNVIPSISQIPSFLSSIRHPKRNRSESFGPQSEADAYEALAHQGTRRKGSISFSVETGNYSPPTQRFNISNSIHPVMSTTVNGALKESSLKSHASPNAENETSISYFLQSEFSRQKSGEKKVLFSKIERPRVRYDVEVITKLIVYIGIAWLAVEGNPVLFELIGLGLGHQEG